MNVNANINYDASSREEFLALIDELSSRNITPNVVVRKPATSDEKGPNEREFLELSGMQRMRLSNEEKTLVESGQLTREQVAAQKVLLIKAENGDGLSVAERQGSQPLEKKDDGEDFV